MFRTKSDIKFAIDLVSLRIFLIFFLHIVQFFESTSGFTIPVSI